MSVPISSAASLQPAPAVAPKASGSLGSLATDVSVGDELEARLGTALDELDANTDAASLLRVQAMTAQLSFMAAALSSTVHSTSDTLKGVIQNLD